MSREDSFAEIFDGMTHNYSKLEEIMSDIYQYLQTDPNNEMAKDILIRLGSLGQNMIFSQREFTELYGDPSLKNSLIDNLDSKEQVLSNAVEVTKSKLR